MFQTHSMHIHEFHIFFLQLSYNFELTGPILDHLTDNFGTKLIYMKIIILFNISRLSLKEVLCKFLIKQFTFYWKKHPGNEKMENSIYFDCKIL